MVAAASDIFPERDGLKGVGTRRAKSSLLRRLGGSKRSGGGEGQGVPRRVMVCETYQIMSAAVPISLPCIYIFLDVYVTDLSFSGIEDGKSFHDEANSAFNSLFNWLPTRLIDLIIAASFPY